MDYTHVLVPLDGSDLAERALGHASAIAGRFGAALVLYSQTDKEERAADREGYLSDVAARLDGGEVSTRVDGAPTPAKGIEQAAAELGSTLLCMSSHGRGGIGEALLGSVAEDVLRRIADPVVLVGPEALDGQASMEGPLVVCADGSKVSEAVLGPAADWARACDMQINLVQVIAADWEAEVAAAGVNPGDVREDSYLRGLVRKLEGAKVDWDVLRARDPRQPADKIVGYARDKGAGMVAMSTHGRTGLRRLVIGSVAMRVVRDSPCPVLVARPPSL
jgi:nucleotide-binding universal stress UspA family protein